MRAHQATYPIVTMARVLGVSTSGYYAWRDRPPSQRAMRDEELLELIVTYHRRSRGNYGAPRIYEDLVQEAGVKIGRKRVARLMRVAGIQGTTRRRGPKTTTRNREASPAPDLVDRNFTATGPNQL